jgi:hypothetical protein
MVTLWSLLTAFAILIALYVQTDEGIRWAGTTMSWGDWDQRRALLRPHFDILSLPILKPLLLVMLTFYLLMGALFARERHRKNTFLFLSLIILAYDLISFGLIYNTASPKRLAYPQTEAIRFLKKDRSLRFSIIHLVPWVFRIWVGMPLFIPSAMGNFCI